MTKTVKRIGPHSRPGKLALIDRRTAEAKLMQRVTDELTKHVGGKPGAVYGMMIEQAARLTLRVHLMDMQALESAEVSERNGRQRLAWSNALSRLLRDIGLQPTSARPQTPQQALEAIRAAHG